MKRFYIILSALLLCLPLMAGIHSYTSSSVLSSGKWVKIRVGESGMCKMTFAQLRQAGLDPAQLRVYGYGGAQLTQNFQMPHIDDLPQVPVYTGDDFVLFWVQGPISWSYNASTGRFVHTRNTYSNYGYYFLTDNTGEKLDAPQASTVAGAPADITTYPDYQVHDFDSLNLIDPSGVSGGGRTFFGEQFRPAQKRTFSFSTPNAVAGEKLQVYIEVAGYSAEYSYMRGAVNGTNTSTASIKPYKDYYTMGNIGTINSSNIQAQADRQEVRLTYSSGLSTSSGWLNYIELTTPSALRMQGAWMPVRTNVNYGSSTPVRFVLSGVSARAQVWDITKAQSIQRMPTTLSQDTIRWIGSQADGVHEYVVFEPAGTQWVSAEVVGEVKNQNLHRLSNIDYVIICPEGYEAVSEDLAKAHEQKEGITWAVVTDQQVYNEFSSGTPDATAYRWLMKMLYDRADGNGISAPRWLLLMGHGSFDNRKLLATSGTALLLTYQAKASTNEVEAYATDDYFGFLDDNEGEVDTNGRLDIGVGRLPVSNLTEARETVDKLIRYIRNEQTGKWKNRILFLSDDGEGGQHTVTSEITAEQVRLKNPDFVVQKVFLDAYPQEVNASGERYPLAKNRVENLLKEGVIFFDYSGHGSFNAITNEAILLLKDIEKMKNENLGFWLFATCNFAQCDAGRRSSAEVAVLNPNGGAVGVFSATRTVYATQNNNLNRSVCDTLFGHSNAFHYDMSLGEALAIGKNRLGSDANKMAYVLLGDPAIHLNYPTKYQVETFMPSDTLNALSVQQVEGRILDEDSATVSSFNGTVDITIYDKMQVIRTRDNDGDAEDEEEGKDLQYNDFPNVIYSGTAEVKEGLFNYTFMIPKDIRYNYGSGRIVYYARTEDEPVEEAAGHYHDFIVGGSCASVINDTLGPELHIYLNTPAFKDGDKTYETPRFFADIYDENGINTAGAGVGHDLMLIIDEDAKKTFSLNEYFTASNSSYQAGQVSYLMETLENGPHTLTFRAWDLLNNSSTQTLNFVVQAGLDPSIYSITTYPNPARATDVINLVVNYDQPDELLTSEIYLYNTSGQVLYSHTQNNPDRVSISLPALGLSPGIYIYSVKIKSASSRYSTSSGKIIVTK